MARRRKRRSRKKNDVIQTKKRTSSAGANFLSFIFGMATTVTLVLWSFSTINSRSAQADTAPDSDTAKKSVLGQDYDELEALMESRNVPEVSAKLMDLNDWPRGAELPVRVSSNRDREKVAKKLLRMDGIAESDRIFAIESLIEALAAIYGLDLFYNLNDKQIGDQLKEVAEQHINDTNEQVVRSSNLALLKYHAFEFVKYRKEDQYDALEESLFSILDQYPNDGYTISNVRLIFKSLTRLHPDVSGKLTKLLLKKRNQYTGTRADQLVADLADASTLLETRYETMFANRWVNGKAGREQLLETSLKLVSDKSAGRALLEQVDKVAQWFEQQNNLDQAREIYQALLDEADRPDNPLATKTSRLLGQNGLTRCNSLGQPARFSGVDIRGRPITEARFKGRIVAVVFWSLKSSASQKELRQLHQEKTQISSQPADILAVCIDKDPGPEFGKLAEQLFRFNSFDPAKYGDTGIPFSGQVPVTRVPHIMLINQQGIICDTNVPGNNLRSHIEYLSTKR